MVLECSRADTGVGATMDPQSQDWKGTWAALVKPARHSSARGNSTPREGSWCCTRYCRESDSLLPVFLYKRMMALTKATPPSMFIHKAREPFLMAMSLPSWLINMKEQRVV